MRGFINGIDFINEPAEKYWSFPKAYKGDSKEETKYMIKSGDYIGAEKIDGHYARLIKDEDGNIILQGRSKSVNGEYLDKHKWCPQFEDFFNALPNGTCLLGELYLPSKRGSRNVTTILGCLCDKALSRQEQGEKLNYYIFDIWAWNGKSFLKTKIENRIDCLEKELSKLLINQKYIAAAKYIKGVELWNSLGDILNSGGEGIVITKLGTTPEPGKRTSRKTLKVKQAQTIDAFIDGDYKTATRLYNGKCIEEWNFWQNVRTSELSNENHFNEYISGGPWEPITKAYYNGWASAISLSVMRNDKPEHIAWVSGITDFIKEEIIKPNNSLIGKVVEVSAMQLEKKGDSYSLRHGKIIQFREDKTMKDCDFSQLA